MQLKPLFSFAQLPSCELKRTTWNYLGKHSWLIKSKEKKLCNDTYIDGSVYFTCCLQVLNYWLLGPTIELPGQQKFKIFCGVEMEMQIVMWAYHEKANGSLLFLLEFNLKVFLEKTTQLLEFVWLFPGRDNSLRKPLYYLILRIY